MNRPPETAVEKAIRLNYPTRCPWWGHTTVCPTFRRDRKTWLCCWCQREFCAEG